jgi:hypothetical protein
MPKVGELKDPGLIETDEQPSSIGPYYAEVLHTIRSQDLILRARWSPFRNDEDTMKQRYSGPAFHNNDNRFYDTVGGWQPAHFPVSRSAPVGEYKANCHGHCTTHDHLAHWE